MRQELNVTLVLDAECDVNVNAKEYAVQIKRALLARGFDTLSIEVREEAAIYASDEPPAHATYSEHA